MALIEWVQSWACFIIVHELRVHMACELILLEPFGGKLDGGSAHDVCRQWWWFVLMNGTHLVRRDEAHDQRWSRLNIDCVIRALCTATELMKLMNNTMKQVRLIVHSLNSKLPYDLWSNGAPEQQDEAISCLIELTLYRAVCNGDGAHKAHEQHDEASSWLIVNDCELI